MTPMQADMLDRSGRPLFRLLLVGVVVWLVCAVAVIAWFFTSAQDPGLMAVAVPFYAWSMAYTPGGIAMVLYGGVQALRKRMRWPVVAAALAVYFLPMIASAAVFALFRATQPTAVTQGDLPMMMTAFAGPLFFLLYVAGLIAGYMRRNRSLAKTLAAVFAPPLAGVILQAVFVVAFTLTSPHWKSRHDLELDVHAVHWRAPGLMIEARLLANEDHEAVMHAFYRDRRGESGRGSPVARVEFGGSEFEKNQDWTRTPIALRTGGDYPLKLYWDSLDTSSLDSERVVIVRIVQAPNYHSGDLIREFSIPVDPDPDTLAALDARLRPVSRDGRTGYVDRAGRMVIEPSFDWADAFHEGLARVRVQGRYGFIDETGSMVIPVRYDGATPFSEGLAGVRLGREAGYIDRNDQTVIPFLFDHANPFAEGLARVSVDGREGYIDRSGEIVIAPRWDWAKDFHNGLAAVRLGERWGFIDRNGEMVIEPRFHGLRCCPDGRWEVMDEKTWGYINEDGAIVMGR